MSAGWPIASAAARLVLWLRRYVVLATADRNRAIPLSFRKPTQQERYQRRSCALSRRPPRSVHARARRSRDTVSHTLAAPRGSPRCGPRGARRGKRKQTRAAQEAPELVRRELGQPGCSAHRGVESHGRFALPSEHAACRAPNHVSSRSCPIGERRRRIRPYTPAWHEDRGANAFTQPRRWRAAALPSSSERLPRARARRARAAVDAPSASCSAART